MPARTPSPVRGRRPRGAVIAQLLKFGLVGVSNTAITFLIYTLLVKLGVWYLLASALGFGVGAINGYLLNRSWTFRGGATGAATAVRWIVVQSCGLLANLGLVYTFVDGAGLGKLPGQALATVLVVGLTFVANRQWTFRVRMIAVGVPEEPDSAQSVPAPSAGAR